MAVHDNRPRSPGVTYAALTLVLLALVGLFALTQRQPPPPSIAEFAPQSVDNITDAPTDQSSASGRGGGEGGDGGDATPTPAAAPDAINVPRVRKCVGDPPRQVEDPQSPPCVPYWTGDNGGATWKGVDRDTIRVAVAKVVGEQSDADAYAAFFNKRFEFYGRKIEPIVYEPTAQTIPQMLAEAQKIDEQHKVFANLAYNGGSGTDLNGRERHFYDELARRQIVSVSSMYNGPANSDQAHFTKFAPYQWTYVPSVDQIEDNVGRFACGSLAGRPPQWAKPPTRTDAPRVFGAISLTYTDGTEPVDIGPLEAALQRCGVKLAAKVTIADQSGDTMGAVLRMKEAGVTTVIPFVHTATLSTGLMPAATSNAYFPEWLIHNFIHHDDDGAVSYYPKDQASSVYGLRSMNKSLPLGDTPWVWARREVDAAYTPPASFYWDFLYWDMLALASGIQMAGPRLTPKAFEAALFKTQFPNPGCGNAPYYQGCVGFGPGDHSMINDFAPIWTNPQARSYEMETGNGAYCYAKAGIRYGGDAWPKGDIGLFQDPCR